MSYLQDDVEVGYSQEAKMTLLKGAGLTAAQARHCVGIIGVPVYPVVQAVEPKVATVVPRPAAESTFGVKTAIKTRPRPIYG